MKTAIKLNKKQLFELYEKSSALVKKNLRMEFGEGFFMVDKPAMKAVAVMDAKSNKAGSMKWEAIFDLTSVLRIAIYACLIWIILK
jgi:hypothetical protein